MVEVSKRFQPTLEKVPFDQALQLETSLTYTAFTGQTPAKLVQSQRLQTPQANAGPPQTQPNLTATKTRLPGYPAVSLPDPGNEPTQDEPIFDLLKREFCTPDLDKMSPHLVLVAKKSSDHITPLHGQLVRGRSVVVSENPELHLVWFGQRVFLKPLPAFLLSWAFWKLYLVDKPQAMEDSKKAAIRPIISSILGFVRTYSHLIQHESDFRLARESGLLPSGVEDFTTFTDFITTFTSIQDCSVNGRYNFGELRLSRLNFWTPLLLPGRWQFYKPYWDYGDYLAQFYGPLLFCFATLSLLLSAMQVVFAASPPGDSWEVFADVSRIFSVVVVVFLLVVCAVLLGLLLGMACRDFIHSWGVALGKKFGKGSAPQDSTSESTNEV